jgi:hypothetical protein
VKRQRELELLTCSPELSIGIPYAEWPFVFISLSF